MDTIQTLTEAYGRLSSVQKAEFNKKNGLAPIPESTKFERTTIVVSAEAKTQTFTQSDIHKMLVDSGQFSNNVDNDIAKLKFDNKPEYSGCESVSAVVDKFTQNLTHRDIIAESKILQSYMQVDLLQGALLAIELVKAGAIKEKNRGIVIYLKETMNGISCGLHVWRDGDGKVKVCVSEVNPGNGCHAANGVLSSN